ncbi:hypothetical protein K2X40_01695 [Candidatus Babeliales bacterium]|nr:hypothetical protein [Candidatus Babeliales bacterium]
MKKIYYALLMLSFIAGNAHAAAGSPQENTSSKQDRLERREAIKASLHHPNRKLRQDINLRVILGHKAVEPTIKIVDNEKMIIILGHKRKLYRSQIREYRHQEKQLADKIEKLRQKISELKKEKSSNKSIKRQIKNLVERIRIKNNQAYNVSIDKMTLKSTLTYINNKLDALIAERSSYHANPMAQQAKDKAHQEFVESRIIGHELRCIYFDKLARAKRAELAMINDEKSPFAMASYEPQRQSLLGINQQLCQLCVSRQEYAHYPNLQALKEKAYTIAQKLEQDARARHNRLATTSILFSWDDSDQKNSEREERMKKNNEHRIMKDSLNLLERAVKEYMFE